MKELTKSEKINMNIKDISKEVKQQLKTKYPKCKFSITIERYSGGQAMIISLMSANFKAIKNFKDISKDAIEFYGNNRYTPEQLKEMQERSYSQLNHYQLMEEYDSDKWCNGIFLTEKAHQVLQDAIKISNQYNYDESDIQTDYFCNNFYLHINIGKWNKPYTQEE